ncbi:MAG: cell division protein SepF, partial [Raoultibacter sp.]
EDYDEDGYAYEEGSYAQGRNSQGRHSSRSSSRASTYGSSRGDSPRLVSIDDVRANTQIPDSLKRDPLPPRRDSASSVGSSYDSGSASSYSSSSGYRPSFSSSRQVERAADYLRSTDTSDLPAEAQRSEGLNSLFTSTTPTAPAASVATVGSTTAYDPYEAFSGSGAATHNPSRSLSVLKPANYGEVERVAKIVKAGDVVVLSLRNTPDHLAKRILDFSFGVSAALDASVECVADKVFVILRGASLSEAELTALRGQGVL